MWHWVIRCNGEKKERKEVLWRPSYNNQTIHDLLDYCYHHPLRIKLLTTLSSLLLSLMYVNIRYIFYKWPLVCSYYLVVAVFPNSEHALPARVAGNSKRDAHVWGRQLVNYIFNLLPAYLTVWPRINWELTSVRSSVGIHVISCNRVLSPPCLW